MMDTLIVVLLIWVIVGAGWLPFSALCDAEAHDVIWWPITLFKALVKTLYLALFTGWRL